MKNEDDVRDFVRSSAVTGGYHVLYDWSGDGSIVSTIVRAVTEVAGRPPEERVHDRIDADGLDMLFRRASGRQKRDEGSVTFPFAGFEITVNADGVIHLEELEGGSRSSK